MLTTTKSKAGPFDGDGVTVLFDADFPILAETETKVVLTDEFGSDSDVDASDYTVVPLLGAFPTESFMVSLNTAAATGEKVTILRNMPLTQPEDYGRGGPYDENRHEESYDRTAMNDQYIYEVISRCLKLSPASDLDSEDIDAIITEILAAASRTEDAADRTEAAANSIITVSEEFVAGAAQQEFITSFELPDNTDATFVWIDGVKQGNSTLTIDPDTNSVTVGAALAGGESVEIATSIVSESGAVITVFGRSGPDIVAATSDYDASQVDNDSGVTGATVAAALDTLESAAVTTVFGRSGPAVSAAASDYDASQVDNDSGVAGATVAAALDTLAAATGSIDSNSESFTAGAAQTQFTTAFTIEAINSMIHVFIDGVKQDESTITIDDTTHFSVGAALAGGENVEITQISW